MPEMTWWMWLFVIAGGIAAGYFIIIVLMGVLPVIILGGLSKLRAYSYDRYAKKRNKKAKQLRLQRTDYEGWPLPVGKEGEIILTEQLMLSLPSISNTQLKRIYTDRAADLGVVMEIDRSPLTRNITIRWGKKNMHFEGSK